VLFRSLTLVDPIEGSELLYEVIAYPATHFRLGTHGTVSVLKNVTDLRHATEQVTEHVRRLQAAESATRAERDQLDLILRSVPDPILVVDADNQIIKLNSEALRLFRSGLGRVADAPPDGRHLRRQQICLGNDAKFTSFLAQLRLDPLPVKSGELALLDPDTEEELAMWVTATEIRNNLGAVSSVVSVMHNLAPVRELERRRVQQALFDSEKLAATGRLAASIAHEINNPLEAIKNALYVLAHKLPPDDANQRMVMIASKETERVSGILRELLGFYRQPAKTVPTAVNELIEEAEQLVSALLRQRGVRLQLELSEALPPVMASADQLKQVLLNLVLNGVEAMPQGGTILIATRTTGAGEHGRLVGDAVQIQVHDTGVGIAEEHLPHIFEPFFSTKQDQKGTGLGLWVSYDIIRRHGGTLRVHSRPGRGTTFTISLPIGGMPGEGAGDEGGEGDAER
jgi:signal transduction histidine kinase